MNKNQQFDFKVVVMVIMFALGFGLNALLSEAEASHPSGDPTKYNFPPGLTLEMLNTMTKVEHFYSMPQWMLVELAYVESRYKKEVINCSVKSEKGAMGLMQIIPKYHPNVNPCNVNMSIVYAGFYLNKLYERFGTWHDALMAYNWGPTNLARAKRTGSRIPGSVQGYATRILNEIGVVIA
jgi:hypothetical protein